MRVFLSALVLLFSTMVSANTLDKMIVFGDSLSDNGNLYEYMKHQLPQSPPYYNGRFSNGPVWIELLADTYFANGSKDHLLDYAYAGAGVVEDDDEPLFTLHSEIDSYLLSHQDKADENALYVVWIGSNNYLAIPDDVEGAVKSVNHGIKGSLQRLIDKGARNFLILNLPDLGHIPLARELQFETQLSALSVQHNLVLHQNIEELKAANPSVKWAYVDIQHSMDDMLAHPSDYGLSNVTDTCYEAAMEDNAPHTVLRVASHLKKAVQKNACDGYLFFDPVHPSIVAHRILAERARLILDEAGFSFSG